MHVLFLIVTKLAAVAFGLLCMCGEDFVGGAFGDFLAGVLAPWLSRWQQSAPAPQCFHPWYATFSCLVGGGFSGYGMTCLLPHRIIQHAPLPGASIIIAPILAAAFFRFLGARRWATSTLFTLKGGWAFTFAFAGLRFLLTRAA